MFYEHILNQIIYYTRDEFLIGKHFLIKNSVVIYNKISLELPFRPLL